jgi:WD repeat-containing protein 61
MGALVCQGKLIMASLQLINRPLANRSADKSIKIWDIGARAAVSTVQDTDKVWAVSWRPKPSAAGSSGAFVTGGEDGVVKWWRGAGSGGP